MKHYLLPLALTLSACGATDDGRPNVVLDTELGEIEIEVHLDTAPISGADFLMHVDKGLYVDQGFYRVVRADNDPRGMGMSLIQGGILSQEFDTPLIAHELTTDTGLSNTRGVISIARDAPGTGSAGYFFINIGDNSFLDTGGDRNPDGAGYATFGTIIRGMDVVENIHSKDASGDSPSPVTDNQYLTQPVKIVRAYRVEN
ncbi:peptidyl-prolyl cis-trans isomerase [Algimonas arctica]|uniref:peptidylprolyl isomerase n=1 Tax=Algimonas arctica TaxID=1479486 RepID=A0A8J3CSA1_9PROT|nr:peptidylprolyl isomerase [Algimonas arctica]GHA93795.1 peptidyl-prolyl cis-trans isomerase [Algimonas arctica]